MPIDNETVTGRPVDDLNITFSWNSVWVPVFDRQIDLIRSDIDRAIVEDKIIVYLSCPISSRGGGHDGTNVEVAKFVENRLMDRFGEKFWVLNPARYQMESREGKGLIIAHAAALGWTKEFLEEVQATVRLSGGDYMRMWTKILAENKPVEPVTQNVGDRFDMFYFIGPQDVAEFFVQGTSQNLTAAIEGYLARKHATDHRFVAHFEKLSTTPAAWISARKNFFRFYAIKSSANFSLGSHDEWNIFRLLNEKRQQDPKERVGARIAGFFDGRQIDLASAEAVTSKGYEQ